MLWVIGLIRENQRRPSKGDSCAGDVLVHRNRGGMHYVGRSHPVVFLVSIQLSHVGFSN